ncbi:hypothetical protein [Dactylosporangium roseum]|uniref:hypothetical protein n=1 Tax=Dactylosporangium roseum TaxID=47989 RepID=UPI0031E09B9C
MTELIAGLPAIPGVPHVTGVRTSGGDELRADPSVGRGVTTGMVHAQLLRHTVRDYLDDRAGFARAWHKHTEELVAPYYWSQIGADRARLAEMTALREGRQWSAPESDMGRLANSALHDADAFRALLEIAFCLALPREVLERPGIKDTIERQGHGAPLPTLGPDRKQLLRLLSA